MKGETMWKKKLVAAVAVFTLGVSAVNASEGVVFHAAKGNMEKAFGRMLKSGLEKTGFVLSDPHERINDAYRAKYSTPEKNGKPNPEYDPAFKETLDTLGFFTVSNDAALRPLLLIEPSLGGFSPFNLYMYKKKGEDVTRVGHIVPETMLDIVGVKDAAVRKAFVASFEPLDRLVADKIGGKVEYIAYDKLPARTMMRFELAFDRPDDLLDFIDEFQENFEAAFEDRHYIIAGYKNFREAYDETGADFSRYDAYWVYSLCHFRFSYEIFNKGVPEAGVFAPCSMYMYIEKDSHVLHIGMPTLENWSAVIGIKDPAMLKGIHDIDSEIVAIMKELGAKQK